jgi:hypothetical protein
MIIHSCDNYQDLIRSHRFYDKILSMEKSELKELIRNDHLPVSDAKIDDKYLDAQVYLTKMMCARAKEYYEGVS